jgi:hypothetical protein
LKNLLNGLKELKINGINSISELKGLLNGLKELKINGINSVSELKNLPIELKFLMIRGSTISELKNLPNGSKELCIKNKKLKNYFNNIIKKRMSQILSIYSRTGLLNEIIKQKIPKL